MNILIIEDDLIIQKYLKKIIRDNFPTWDVDTCNTYEEGLYMSSTSTYNLFIIDYELDKDNLDKNGIALGIAISSIPKYSSVPIIFETTYTDKVLDAVNNLNCVYYLVKPYNDNQVIYMLNKILNYIPLKQTISLKDECGISAYINVEDIIYVEANRHKLIIVLPNTTFICTSHSLDALEKLCGGVLIRCHKSFLVNKYYISNIDKRTYSVNLTHPTTKRLYFAKLGRLYMNIEQT